MVEAGGIQESLPMRQEWEARANLVLTQEEQDEEEMAMAETADATEQEILWPFWVHGVGRLLYRANG